MNEPILHITTPAEWQAAQAEGVYRPPSLAEEGFIHCSTPAQVTAVADERFAGRDDLILLVIDPGRLDAPPVYEDPYASGQRFPHIYGPLPAAAVIRALPFACGPGGRFRLPAGIARPA